MAACSGFPEESYDTVSFIILDKMDKIGRKKGVAERARKEGFAKESTDRSTRPCSDEGD